MLMLIKCSMILLCSAMMPGVGHIGGRLSVIGGSAGSRGVDVIESYDGEGDEWANNNGMTVRKPR